MRKVVFVLVVAVIGLGACGADDDDTGGAGGGGLPGGNGGGGASGGGGMAGGAAGAAGGMGGLSGECAMANVSIGNAALHANAAMALQSTTCSGSTSCHQGSGKAKLVLKDMPNMRAALVDKMSCEAPNIPLVDSSGNAKALMNSWLWIKLTGPLSGSGDVMGNAAVFGTPGNCDQASTGTYGIRMPFGFGATMTWGDANKVRDWICAGAPGP
jgi:hypothetical protein